MSGSSPGTAGPVDVSVVTSGHDVADARLHREVSALLAAGLRVEVLGLGDPRDAPVGALARTWSRGGLARRAAHAFLVPWRARGAVLLSLDPDSALGCAAAARLRRRRWVADVHEDYPALLEDRAWSRGPLRAPARALARAATAVVSGADLTVVADEHVPPLAGEARERLVVRNLPDLAVVQQGALHPGAAHAGAVRTGAVAQRAAGPASRPVHRAVYVGDGRRSRGLERMLDTIALAPGWELDLVGPLHGGDEDWARDRIDRHDLRGRVRLHGRLPPDAAWRVAEGAQVGLALLHDTPAFRAAVPTKVYEYLAAGLAVLATPLPRVADLVRSSRGGALAATAVEAASVLRVWAEHPDRLEQVRASARAWATESLAGPSPYVTFAERVAVLAHRS